MIKKERIEKIVAVDPGYERCGLAIILNKKPPTLLFSRCIRTSTKEDHTSRLASIFYSVYTILKKESPDILALETLFFSLNKKTALKVAEARGVVLAAAGRAQVPVLEISPQTIKLSIAGYGNADKKAVRKMVSLMLHLDTKKLIDDEVDAIAIGLTAGNQRKTAYLKNV